MDPQRFDPERFSGTVPVFPLPNVVLFPGMFLPLHIFEPRYREMTRDVLAGERLLAMALLKPGWEENYEGAPAIHPMMGLGKIVEDRRLEDGRFNLVLFGLVRVRVREELKSSPYRKARVEILEERAAEGEGMERRRRFLRMFYAQVVRELTKGSLPEAPDDVPLGVLCDLLCSVLSFDAATRQGLLEELDVTARCDRLLSLLQGPGQSPSPPQRRWPRGPSLN